MSAARTKPQLATGPQKWVVLGPVGELMKAEKRDAKDMRVRSNYLKQANSFVFIVIIVLIMIVILIAVIIFIVAIIIIIIVIIAICSSIILPLICLPSF